MSIGEARTYVNNLQNLTEGEKQHLKQLLNIGTLVPGAIIDADLNELRQMMIMNPLQGKFLIISSLSI